MSPGAAASPFRNRASAAIQGDGLPITLLLQCRLVQPERGAQASHDKTSHPSVELSAGPVAED